MAAKKRNLCRTHVMSNHDFIRNVSHETISPSRENDFSNRFQLVGGSAHQKRRPQHRD